MTVKSQLHACVDSLMSGLKAAERAAEPDPRVLATIRACLDVVERLEHSSKDVTVFEVEIALKVVKQAALELSRDPIANTVKVTVRNAVDRLERLRDELKT